MKSLKIIMGSCTSNTLCTWNKKIRIIHASPTHPFPVRKNFIFFPMLIDTDSPHPHQSMITLFFFSLYISLRLRNKKKIRTYRRRCIGSLNKQNFNALFMCTSLVFPGNVTLQFSTAFTMAAVHVACLLSHFYHEIHKFQLRCQNFGRL